MNSSLTNACAHTYTHTYELLFTYEYWTHRSLVFAFGITWFNGFCCTYYF